MLIQHINLDNIPDSKINQYLSYLPEKIIQDSQILVLDIINNDNTAVIGIAESHLEQHELCREIGFRLGKKLVFVLVDKEQLSQRIASVLHKQAQEDLTDEAPIVKYVEKLFSDAINQKASDIHIETEEHGLKIRFRIDGILYDSAKLSEHLAPRVIAHLKVLAQLDMTERRLPQDGRLSIVLNYTDNKIDCRLSSCPTLHGEKVVLRLLNNTKNALNTQDLGFSDYQHTLFLRYIQKPQGMIIVTGPTGSGKTVTLYSALHVLNKPDINILSVEDPVEIDLPGINQVPINDKINLTFSSVLRTFLRQDPDIIMVGEMRDLETADIAIKAAQTGHLVLSTLHTNSAAETLTRLLHMGIPAYHIASSVTLIIAQRLIRVLCCYCHGQFHRGCSHCQKGFLGRIGIYELLPITPAIAELILKNPDPMTLEKTARQEGMQTLYENGLEKVAAEITTMNELLSVVNACAS